MQVIKEEKQQHSAAFSTLVIGNGLVGSKQDNTVAVFIIIGNLMVFFLASSYEISDYRHELGLRSLEDLLSPYFTLFPFRDQDEKKIYDEQMKKVIKSVSEEIIAIV